METRPFLTPYSIYWRRHRPDDYRGYRTRIAPPVGLAVEAKAVAFAETVPDTADFDVQPSGHDVAGILGITPRFHGHLRAGREFRPDKLETTAQIGRQKLLHQP